MKHLYLFEGELNIISRNVDLLPQKLQLNALTQSQSETHKLDYLSSGLTHLKVPLSLGWNYIRRQEAPNYQTPPSFS